jgi:hypothetical protein
MRTILCNSMAYELMEKVKEVGMELAHVWFMDRVKEEELKNSEIFYVVLLAGGIRDHVVSEPPKTERVYPWEIEKKDYQVFKGMSEQDKQRYLNGEFTDLRQQKEEVARNVEKRMPQRPVHVSANCMRDARKALGVFPYDEPGNYLVGDGYFSRDCIGKYGEKMWNAACEQVQNEKKRR